MIGIGGSLIGTVVAMTQWRVGPRAAWLDRLTPGWYNRINLDQLNLFDNRGCVLGQVYGDFEGAPLKLRGRRVLFLRRGRVAALAPIAYAPIRTRGWKKAIMERRLRDQERDQQQVERVAWLGGLIRRAERAVPETERDHAIR